MSKITFKIKSTIKTVRADALDKADLFDREVKAIRWTCAEPANATKEQVFTVEIIKK